MNRTFGCFALALTTLATAASANAAERTRLLRYETSKQVTASSCTTKSYLGGFISGSACSSQSDPEDKARDLIKTEAAQKLREACEKPSAPGVEPGHLRGDPLLVKGACRPVFSDNKTEVSCSGEFAATCVTGTPDTAAVRDPKVNDSRSAARAERIMVDKETGIRYRIDVSGIATEIDDSVGAENSATASAAR